MKEFYTAIAEVYQTVQRETPPFHGNPCGECRSCCSATEMSGHKVSKLEFDALAHHIGAERAEKFRQFLARERDDQDQLIFAQCPNLDSSGCTVHPIRPLSCRLYGHFRSETAELFDHCVFKGHETVLPDDQEHLLSPGQTRLTELSLEYLTYFPSSSLQSSSLPAQLKPPQTPLEHASHLCVTGDYSAAITLLKQLRQSEDSANVILMLAECYEYVQDYAEAVSLLDEAISRSPSNPELYSRKGANCLWWGRLAEARQALEQSLRLADDRRNTHGLLGLACQLSGDLQAALSSLGRAVALEEEPSPYRLQLAMVHKELGQTDQARIMLKSAAEYGPSAGQADRLLGEL